MNCKYHQNKTATNTCSVCGDWICEDCVLDINGRIYCKDCLRNNINQNEYMSYRKEIKHKSTFLTFIFSFIPGLSQMYLGLYKRGILIMLTFFALGCMDNFLSAPLLFFSIFDSFRIKDKLNKGLYVEDNLNDIKRFVVENKGFLFILLCIAIIPSIFEGVEDFFEHGIFRQIGNALGYNFVSILAILVGGTVIITLIGCITAIVITKRNR